MSTSASTASSLHFGPEWMRTSMASKSRPQSSTTPPPAAVSTANTYSSLLTPPLQPSPVTQDDARPFCYSKEQLLNIWKEGGGRGPLGLEVERWEGVVRAYAQDPVGTKEMSEGEAKLFAMPLNSRRQSFSHDLAIASPSGGLGKFSGSPSSPMRERFTRRGDSSGGINGGGLSRPRQPSLSLASPPTKGDGLPSPRPRLTGGNPMASFDGVLNGGLARRKSSMSFGVNVYEADGRGQEVTDPAEHRPEGPNDKSSRLDDSSTKGTADAEDAKRQAARAAALKDPSGILWTYVDPSGQLQGPFAGASMQGWYDAYYFDSGLKTRRPEVDEEFVTVGEWVRRAGDTKAFLSYHPPVFSTPSPPVPPPGLPAPLTHLTRTHSPSSSSASESSAIPNPSRVDTITGLLNATSLTAPRSVWSDGAVISKSNDDIADLEAKSTAQTEKQNLSERLQHQARLAQERHQQTLQAISGPVEPLHYPATRSDTFTPASNASSSPASSYVPDQAFALRPQEQAFEQAYQNTHSSPYISRPDSTIADVNAFQTRRNDQPYPTSRAVPPTFQSDHITSGFPPRNISGTFDRRGFESPSGGLGRTPSIDQGNGFGLPFNGFVSTGIPSQPYPAGHQGYGALRTDSPSFGAFNATSGGFGGVGSGIVMSPHEPSPFNGPGFSGHTGMESPSGFGPVGATMRPPQTTSTQRDESQRNSLRGTPDAFSNAFPQSAGGIAFNAPPLQQSQGRPFNQPQQATMEPNIPLPQITTPLSGPFTPGSASSPWGNAQTTSILSPSVIFGPTFPKTSNLTNPLAHTSDASAWQNGPNANTPTSNDTSGWPSSQAVLPAPAIPLTESPWSERQDADLAKYRTVSSGWGNIDEPIAANPATHSQSTRPFVAPQRSQKKSGNADAVRETSDPIGTKSKKQGNGDGAQQASSKRNSLLSSIQTTANIPSSEITPSNQPTTASPVTAPKAAWQTNVQTADDEGKQSLREIQELEATRKADARKVAAAEREKRVPMTPSATDDSVIFTTTWGLPTSQAGAARSTPKDGQAAMNSSPVMPSLAQSGAVWSTSSAVAQGKKSMKEIQEEEERRKKEAVKEKETAAAAAKRAYAETANKNVVPTTPNVGGAWSTVGVGGKTVGSAVAPLTVVRPVSSTQAATSAPATQPRTLPPATTAPAPRPANGLTTSTISSRAGTASPQLTKPIPKVEEPPAPSPDFIRWLKEALKGLNNINLDEFVQLLLTFPLDPSPQVMETISDSIYANSSTMDGRRFATDFCARRKVDAASRPSRPGAAPRGTSLADVVKTQPKPAQSEWAYKVVKKKGKGSRS